MYNFRLPLQERDLVTVSQQVRQNVSIQEKAKCFSSNILERGGFSHIIMDRNIFMVVLQESIDFALYSYASHPYSKR